MDKSRANSSLIQAMMGGGAFSNDNDLLVLKKKGVMDRKPRMTPMTPNSRFLSVTSIPLTGALSYTPKEQVHG